MDIAKTAAWIRRALSGLFAVLMTIGSSLSGEPYIASGDAELKRSLLYSYAEGVSFMQGIACDGDVYYGFGANKFLNYSAITKIDVQTGKIIERREMCLPKELMRRGYSHLGDGCLHDGKLYIALEDFGFRHPGVITYDPETLEYLDFKTVPDAARGNGRIPWCEIDENGVLYFTQSNDVKELRMLRASDLSFLGTIPLDRTLYKVQGGELLDGRMILVTNEGRREKNIYSVDLATGHVEILFVRCTGKLDAEGEGIAVCPAADGSVLHILDAGKCGVRIGNYALKP